VIHVLADIVTSILAVFALLLGRYTSYAVWFDAALGIVGGILILRWAWGLLKQTLNELLDLYPSEVLVTNLKQQIESDGHQVTDLHLWSQGQGTLVGILSVIPANEDADFRSYFHNLSKKLHLSVEKRSRN
jgi:Co/Zn/Cd efflux system component